MLAPDVEDAKKEACLSQEQGFCRGGRTGMTLITPSDCFAVFDPRDGYLSRGFNQYR